MKRILVIGRAYPNASHNYINNDVDYLATKAQVLVLSPNQPMAPFYSPHDCNYFDNIGQLIAQARQFRPDFIISWLLPNHSHARQVAEALGVPFVLKLHTPDRLIADPARLPWHKRLATHLLGERKLSKHYLLAAGSLRKTARSEWLRGVYCIPDLIDDFSRFFPPAKVLEMQSRIPYATYHDEAPNGERVMVLGSLLERREGDRAFADILSAIDGPVDWYPIPTPGCLWLDLPNLPANLNIRKYVPPAGMPALYKHYKALIQIGRGAFSRGRSLSIIEAQAAGVTVLAPSLRPAYDAFVEQGGGWIFREESEIPGILRQLPDAGRRALGFQHAARFDIAGVEEELARGGLFL